MKYVVIIEKAESNYSAYVPDLPGCVSAGGTIEEVEELIRGAIAFHLEGMREDGEPAPPPTSIAREIETDAPPEPEPPMPALDRLRIVPKSERHTVSPEALEPRNIRVWIRTFAALDVLDYFKARATAHGTTFQEEMALELRAAMERDTKADKGENQ